MSHHGYSVVTAQWAYDTVRTSTICLDCYNADAHPQISLGPIQWGLHFDRDGCDWDPIQIAKREEEQERYLAGEL